MMIESIEKIKKLFWRMISHTIYAVSLGYIGKHSMIYRPLQINGGRGMHIEKDVYIAQYAWLMADNNRITLRIGKGTVIGHFSHIISINSVRIGEDVLIADKVYISDCTHAYIDVNTPVIKQEIKELKPVNIGDGSWIGENVCIYGASIGRNCVIGANSVVNSDIPDYCIAVGTPAKVVKRYDFIKCDWIKV